MELLEKLPSLWNAALTAGLPSLIGAGVVTIGVLIIMFLLRKGKRDRIERENEERRVAEQARNAQENQEDQTRLEEIQSTIDDELKELEK